MNHAFPPRRGRRKRRLVTAVPPYALIVDSGTSTVKSQNAQLAILKQTHHLGSNVRVETGVQRPTIECNRGGEVERSVSATTWELNV
jgi:hypothetical protein